jgi:hypothetical protein
MIGEAAPHEACTHYSDTDRLSFFLASLEHIIEDPHGNLPT